MKTLIILVVGLLSVGCGQSDIERLEEEKLTQEYETEFQMSEDENKRLEAEIESNKLKALKAETDKTKKEPPTNPTDQNTTKAKPGKEQARELTPDQKQKALGDSVVGEYERKEDGDTFRVVLLENGIGEFYNNGEIEEEDGKWKIIDGELHANDGISVGVLRKNKDNSITYIARIKDSKREEVPKECQVPLKKIK